MELWKFIRKFYQENGRMPFGSEIDKLKILAKEEEARKKVVRIDEFLPPKAPFSAQNQEGWMEGIESLRKDVDDLSKTASEYKDKTVGDFLSDYFGMGKKAETEQEMIERMNKQNKEAVERLKKKKLKEAEEMFDDGDWDPSGMKDGGRIGYAYGKGLDLLKILKKEGTTIKKEIETAMDNIVNFSGDAKYDADVIVDDIIDRLGIDRDSIDEYGILDVYDKAYQYLTSPKRKKVYSSMYEKQANQDMSELFKGIGATKTAEKIDLQKKYPGITNELLDKIVKDNDPQRKAEVLASLEETLTMMDKGMDKDQIINVLKSTKRTKQAQGTGSKGLDYLQGF